MATDSVFNVPSGSTDNTGGTNSACSSNQVAATRRMSRELYEAAVEGKVDVLQQTQHLEHQLTPNKNTVLHLHIRGGMASKDCVSAIVETCPSLLFRRNIKEETALHMAAKEGLTEIVTALVDQAGRHRHATGDLERGINLAGMRNAEGDTALHEAVRHNRVEVVEFLLKPGDPDFNYWSNKAGETPLYVAVKGGFDTLVDEILKTCKSPADYDGPNGLTALHQAIICSDAKDASMVTKIVGKMPELAKTTDKKGWTPLHYAAYFGKVAQADVLLRKDESAAYIADESGKIPLHIAASSNHIKIMEKLVSHCPDCTEVVDKRRRNVLHLAAETGSRKAVKFILKYSWGKNLINDKDINGRTPLHLSAGSLGFVRRSIIGRARVDTMAVSNKGLTAVDILSSNFIVLLLKVFVQWLLESLKITPAARQNTSDDHGSIEKEWVWEIKGGGDHDQGAKDTVSEIKKASKTHLIVAALIATVTYAAGFTLPGGFEEEKGPHRGMAVLAKKATFIAFFATDGIAMCLSTVAVAVYFLMTLQEEQRQLSRWFKLASYSTLCAMVAMVAAFLMAACAVLFSNCVALAALVLFLVINIFLFYFVYPLLAKWVNRGRE